jgi:hypothetical protein
MGREVSDQQTAVGLPGSGQVFAGLGVSCDAGFFDKLIVAHRAEVARAIAAGFRSPSARHEELCAQLCEIAETASALSPSAPGRRF